MDGQHRPEQLRREHLVGGVVADEHRGLDEPALGIVAAATGEDLQRVDGAQDLRQPVVGAAVDDRPAERRQVLDVAERDGAGGVGQRVTDAGGPQRRRHERPRRGRALLPLVLEPAADQRGDQGVRVGAGVGDDEVLAAGLADEPRIGAVAVQVARDRLPQVPERRRRAGEVHPGQVGRGEGDLGDRGPVAGDHVDHPGR